MWKKLILGLFILGLLAAGGGFAYLESIRSSLPKMITVQDYEPLLVSQVYDHNEKKIGEFFRERRVLIPYEKMPEKLVQAFVAAEDHEFFQHSGINLQAIFRAAMANLRAGRTVQGGSTITQQVAKTLLLTPERTLIRKVKDALLAIEIEKNLSKEEIIYLYLNQIYLGNGAYGVGMASEIYFRKPLDKLTLAEMAMLAGLPTAPSEYSPVYKPKKAKERQVYVLSRMNDVGTISEEEMKAAVETPIKVYLRENYEDFAPHFLETVRLLLISKLGESVVLDKGIKIYTSLDLDLQQAAQASVVTGLKSLDKRQGYRGALGAVEGEEDLNQFLADEKKALLGDLTPERTILANGEFAEITASLPENSSLKLPRYMKLEQNVRGVVEAVDDNLGLVYVRVPDSRGVIDMESMTWARKPNADIRADLDPLKKPSAALKKGDIILTKVVAESFVSTRLEAKLKKDAKLKAPDLTVYLQLELDQDPLVEGSLISFNQRTEEVLAMVGGYKFIHKKNEFNRTIQAARQTGSAFKAIIYASALDKGYTPASAIMDAPLVYEQQIEDEEGQEDVKIWKPSNHGRNFGGDILMRNALVQSLNVPTVKIVEDIGVPWAAEYARRLGVFSNLNMDFTLALGSSSVTLYEMTKAFSHFGRLGKRIRPIIITKVEDRNGKVLLTDVSLDTRFEKEIAPIDEQFKVKREKYMTEMKENAGAKAEATAVAEGSPTSGELTNSAKSKKKHIEEYLFSDTENDEQLIRPQTAYVMTSMLKGVIEDGMGTGVRARALGRECAGKTGSTNGYYDAWFIGYTPQISTGVWVGFDREASIGKGEVGGRAALPIWLEYMKSAHEGLPQVTFPVPDGIVFANVDRETGKVANSGSKNVVRLAFVEGTEPSLTSDSHEETNDFLKEDLSE